RPSDGNVAVTSQPAGATVRLGGAYRGETPLDLSLEPGREHVLRFEKAGHTAVERRVQLKPGEAQEVHAELAEEIGELELSVFPADARVRLNGVEVSARRLRLPTARDHRLEVDRDGYVAQALDVRAGAGDVQRVDIRLETAEAKRERTIQSLDRTSEGQALRLIEPGRFQMGASRRESGRRANETLREVEITQRFYLSAHEVTNAQFRRFRPDHRSGAIGDFSLDLDDHPVVRVTWEDAVAYCNWLSQKEGLEPAYVKEGETWVAKSFDGAPPSGYRLPTEAEWAWTARYPQGGPGKGLKYPWGGALPVPAKAGNFADASAAELVSAVLPDYRDGFAATAPVDAFPANARGVHQLGGNVAEWVHDIYVVRPALIGAIERDPRGPKTGEFHVIRGSSWLHSTVTELRLSFRDYGADKRQDVGFRLARPAIAP
ncbi:MAG: SUMF1/EgtB/PvdO family nonheme iron enzyme, partial [Acidobacteriota bacterium]